MQRKNLIGLALFVAAFVAFNTAVAQDVKVQHMPGTDFTKFHTYKWTTIQGASHPNQIEDAQIKQAVDTQLAAKGLTKTDSDTADLNVGYQVAVDQEKQWNTMGGGWRFGGMETATSSTIDIGTLVVDMYDQAGKQLVWSGSATKTIDPGNNQEKNEKNLEKSMTKLFKDYPPKH
jgi:hypothetical protein